MDIREPNTESSQFASMSSMLWPSSTLLCRRGESLVHLRWNIPYEFNQGDLQTMPSSICAICSESMWIQLDLKKVREQGRLHDNFHVCDPLHCYISYTGYLMVRSCHATCWVRSNMVEESQMTMTSIY